MAQSHARLKAAGGRRSSFNLSQDVSTALEKIRTARGFRTSQEAFEFALLQTAGALEGLIAAMPAAKQQAADANQCSDEAVA